MSELNFDDRVQPPMANGEVVFEAPWQSRVFGMAVTLAERGLYDWSDFQQALIEEVTRWDIEQGSTAASHDNEYPYFELFQNALTNLIVANLHLVPGEVENLAQDFASLPHGHDH